MIECDKTSVAMMAESSRKIPASLLPGPLTFLFRQRKAIFSIILVMLLVIFPLNMIIRAEESSSVTSKGDGLFWIDAAVDEPDDYSKITGFKITYKLLESGVLGTDFPLNALMIAEGAQTSEAFEMDYSGSLPKYIGTASEIITHCTGNSFVGPMIFANGVDADKNKTEADKLKVGETATVRYKGDVSLFRQNNSVLSAFGIIGKFEVTEVSWIFGEIDESASGSDLTWEPAEMVQYLDVPTVDNGTDANYVDINVPEGEGPYPVILWIHGGGWTQLDRKACFISDTMSYLQSKGYAVVSAEYTLNVISGQGLTSHYPQMLFDLKAAVRFLRAESDRYNLDTDFIAAMGESAGGHLAMLLGTTNGSQENEDLSMGHADYSSDVQAIVSYFGPADLVGDSMMAYAVLGDGYTSDMAKLASPYFQISEDSPPLFITHGQNDQTVSIAHSKKMEKKAIELIGASQVTAVYYEDAPHANKRAFDSHEAILAVESFLNTHLADTKAVNSSNPGLWVMLLVAVLIVVIIGMTIILKRKSSAGKP